MKNTRVLELDNPSLIHRALSFDAHTTDKDTKTRWQPRIRRLTSLQRALISARRGGSWKKVFVNPLKLTPLSLS